MSSQAFEDISRFEPNSWGSLAAVAKLVEGNYADFSLAASKMIFGGRLTPDQTLTQIRIFDHYSEMLGHAFDIRLGARAAELENREANFNNKPEVSTRAAEAMIAGITIRTFVEAARTITLTQRSLEQCKSINKSGLVPELKEVSEGIEQGNAKATVHMFDHSRRVNETLEKGRLSSYRQVQPDTVVKIVREEIGILPEPVEAQIRAAMNPKAAFGL